MASRILVIDDEEAVGESLRKTLDGEGYEIEIVYRGTLSPLCSKWRT